MVKYFGPLKLRVYGHQHLTRFCRTSMCKIHERRQLIAMKYSQVQITLGYEITHRMLVSASKLRPVAIIDEFINRTI